MSVVDSAKTAIDPAPPPVVRDPWRGARILHATLLALSLATMVAAIVMEVQGESHVALSGWTLPETCVWRKLMGTNCPGCGMTRAFICLVRGDLAGAWHFNPAALPLFAAVVMQIPYRSWQLWRLARGQGEWISRWQMIVPVFLATILFVRWIWWVGSFLMQASFF